MASSPSSSAILSPAEKRYDVFLSFRGEDVRNQFASYLYAALYDKNILTFMDHKLERGDEVSSTLWEAIKESMISVVIFSENYATSTWCLNELVHILECKETNGQTVLPVFYNIDPSIVRKQEGSYGVAFARLEERFKDRIEMVQQWRAALTEATNLCGLDSRDFRPEIKLIQKVVEDILLKLPRYSSWNIKHCNGRLFAIKERMEEIEKLLDIYSRDVRIVGIWGMGGIGKTTLASAIFQRFSFSHFEGRTYLWNVRQEYESFGPNYLRKKLLTDLLKDEGNIVSMDTPFVASPIILDRLRRKKVLIILDDVDSSIQLETLIEGYHQLALGSRIIVTSRNKQVLVKVADEIHKVEGLNNIESLKLFHLHAFGKNSLATDYEIFSKEVASYANGNPLALKVLGSFLHSKSKEEWESALEKLKRVPNKDILKVLRISYDGLDDEMIRNLFLDIACLLDYPFTREYAESILGGGDSYAKIGISTLIDNSLIEIYREEEAMLCMHDLIRQMGWSIVSDEHKEPGKRSRLFDAKVVCQVLEENMGTEAIEGIVFNMSQIKREVRLSRTTFSKMHNLRVLKIACDNIDGNKCKLYLPRGLESLVSHQLRCFQWDYYPLKSLPSDFTPENLVELILRHSHLKQLGNHIVQSLPKLKFMDLSNSKLLTEIADLSQAPNLESLNLEGCTSLLQILSSLQNLHKLTYLNLSGCTNLRDLQEMSGLRGYLDLVKRGDIKNLLNNVCQLNFTLLNSSITSFITNLPLYPSSSSISQKFPMNLTSLHLGGTTIEVVPSSIWCLPSLVLLDLHDCKKLKSVPTSICKLKSLETIFLDGCSNLEEFPEILETMESLNFIDTTGAAIKKLPESIENLIGLTELRLNNCKDIEFLPNTLCSLSRLFSMNLDNCWKLQTLPPCPLELQALSLKNCGSLKLITELPSSLDELDASYCTSLESISSWTSPLLYKMDNFVDFDRGRLKLTNCSKLDSNTRNNILANGAAFSMMFREMLSKRMANETETDDDVEFVYGCYPGDEIPKQFSFQGCGELLDVKLPPDWNSDDLLGVIFCVVLDPIKIDPDILCMICYQVNDGGDHICNRTVQIGKLEHNSDHVFMWFNTKQVNGRNWISTYSNVTDVYFDVWSFLYHGESRYASLGNEYYKIKKCGIRFIYMNDLEQFAPSDDDCEYSKAKEKRVVRFYDEEKDHDHGESHSTSILCKRRFDDGKQEDDEDDDDDDEDDDEDDYEDDDGDDDDDDDDESQPKTDTKKIKLR